MRSRRFGTRGFGMRVKRRLSQSCAWALGIAAICAPTMVREVSVLAGRAQAPATGPAFEVASVKPNKSGDGRVLFSVQPGGRFTATNVTVRMLIRNAYQLQDF